MCLKETIMELFKLFRNGWIIVHKKLEGKQLSIRTKLRLIISS